MTATAPRVITIPANPELVKVKAVRRQLRVAAYCRVSTDSEEQLTSYEAQKNYYTDKIMTNPDWTMAGIFADEGITGTSAAKRPEFLRMIRRCRQKKIDIILKAILATAGEGATVSTSVPFLVRVSITNFRIRSGPGTNTAVTGKFTGVGVFTITEVKDGPGSTKGWGRLKSGAGWISLDYTQRV